MYSIFLPWMAPAPLLGHVRVPLHNTAMAPVPSTAPPKMGTGPNRHGTPSTALAASHVNGLIGNNETHFCHGNGAGAVPSRVNEPSLLLYTDQRRNTRIVSRVYCAGKERVCF